jgi:hypothetical protein
LRDYELKDRTLKMRGILSFRVKEDPEELKIVFESSQGFLWHIELSLNLSCWNDYFKKI